MRKTKFVALFTSIFTVTLLLSMTLSSSALADYNWTDTKGGLSTYFINSFAYDSGRNILYAGTSEHGVWRCTSPNTSPSWTDTGGGLSSSYYINSLAYDSAHDILYAGTDSGGVWACTSPESSPSWTNIGMNPYRISSLAYDPAHDIIYAGIDNAPNLGVDGVWSCTSPESSPSWTNIGMSSIGIICLTYDPVHDALYAGTYYSGSDLVPGIGGGVWRCTSPESSHSWTSTGGGVSTYWIPSLAYDSAHDVLYAGTYYSPSGSGPGTGKGVWRCTSPDSSPSWTNTGVDTSSFSIGSLAYDSAHDVLYAGNNYGNWDDGKGNSGFWSGGAWRCTGPESSPSWTNTGGGLSSYAIHSLAYDSTHNVIYAGAGNPPPINQGCGVWSASVPLPPSTAFYFAEGTCRPDFDPYFCIQNPGSADAQVTLTYMKGDGTAATDTLTVAKNSRSTVSPRTKLGTGNDAAHDFSTKVECTNGQTIIAERPMYFNYSGVWTGGHDVVGATSPSSTFFFAEGTCRPNFDPYFCIQNPGDTAAEVTLTYMKGDGTTATDTLNVAKNSRSTVSPRTKLGTGNDAAHDFSTKVECTNGQTIIAERPMYFNYNGVWTGGHDVVGATSPSTAFFFAEGTCRPNFDPYFCVQNPGDTAASVTLTYMKGDGTTATDQVTVAPNSRSTVSPRTKLGTGNDATHDFSTKVECTNGQSIIAERPMYFNYNGVWTGGHDVVGATSPSTTFFFAEDTCRPDFDPYFCIQNPGATAASVTLTYMKGDGTAATDTLTVAKNSRSTVSPRTKLGTGNDATHDFSTKVECTNGQTIIAERPMYFNYNGVWTGGHDVVGFAL